MHDIVRTARLALPLAALLVAASDAGAGSYSIANAQPRDPQAVVHGNGLQAYFVGVGESIVPSRDQVDVGLLTLSAPAGVTYTLQVELGPNPDGLASGIYNGHDPSPRLMQLFPGVASAGWFAVISFRISPTRAIVNLFDANAAFIGTTTYLGADSQRIGIYAQGAGGTFYSQDARNPGGAPQFLFFRATGINLGGAWMAVEDQPAASVAGADYNDLIWYVEYVGGERVVTVTPVQHSNWGELKARFR